MWESKRIKAVASISQLSALITKITKRMNRKRRNIGHWSSPIKKVLLCKKEEKKRQRTVSVIAGLFSQRNVNMSNIILLMKIQE